MKVCPTCDKVYKHEEINFCLADGTTLLKERGPNSHKNSLANNLVAIILAIAALLVLVSVMTPSWLGSSANAYTGLISAFGRTGSILVNGIGWTGYLLPF